VFVTHDQEEAFVLGDEVAVMQAGRIVQQARPADLYARPASPWVATFVGDANLVAGEGRGDHARTPVGDVALEVSVRGGPAHGPVEVVLRAEQLRLDPLGGRDPIDAPDAVGRRGVPGTVQLTEYYGHDTVYLVRPDDGEPIRARAAATPRFDRGDRVLVTYDGPPAVVFPARPAAASGPVAGAAADHGDPDDRSPSPRVHAVAGQPLDPR
jgi:iron(III) transport system ATP-binding protein